VGDGSTIFYSHESFALDERLLFLNTLTMTFEGRMVIGVCPLAIGTIEGRGTDKIFTIYTTYK
jgi:hypothetical protein